MRVVIVTDAWYPQVNGVVRTLDTVRSHLIQNGDDVVVLGPDQHLTVACPSYPEIRLAVSAIWKMASHLRDLDPDCIHIATEGPLGWSARRYCLQNKLPFTTSFHTRFPEYLKARWQIPRRWIYSGLRHFHRPAHRIMVTTPSMHLELSQRGFKSLCIWTRGVDTDFFRPDRRKLLAYPSPNLLYVGRVAIEKNLEAFLDLSIPGTKHVVGGGPQLEELRIRYPDVVFTGPLFGEALADYYASADVFVFPSKTDTFGLVLLEALASGLPVAAFPVAGPIDVISDPALGCLDEDLTVAIQLALTKDRSLCRSHALKWSWQASMLQFRRQLEPIRASGRPSMNLGGIPIQI